MGTLWAVLVSWPFCAIYMPFALKKAGVSGFRRKKDVQA